MKNQHLWKPSTIFRDEVKKEFVLNTNVVYPGSLHIASIQWKAYRPLLEKYAKGKLLDCGCGKIPYFEVVSQSVSLHYCIDRSEHQLVKDLLDENIDLNLPFDLKEKGFETVLLTDVFAHVSDPATLLQSISKHMANGGNLILTTPFIYWISEYPHEYFHPTEFALRNLCEAAGFEMIQLEAYGGRADVLLDTFNKGMTGRLSNRLFRLLASVLKNSGWYKRTNEKSRYSYPIGYTLVARKL